MSGTSENFPPRFAEIKQEIAQLIPDFERRVTQAWTSLLPELEQATKRINAEGSAFIPQVKFADLQNLPEQEIAVIKRRGCVVIRDVVDDADAAGWRAALKEHVTVNKGIEGMPSDDPQFFMLYWTKPQVQARSHPNVLAASSWLNKLYHLKSGGDVPEGVDLSAPLTYADRFRMRHPGVGWDRHPPHIDGGTIERWEDPTFRACFIDILRGELDKHDPYDLQGRLQARTSLYGRPNQSSIFRTYQGWLALSETAPTEGTLRVFPDVHLSNSYLILRPFFRLKPGTPDADALLASNWEFDISHPDFPGLIPMGSGWAGPRPTPGLHPHMQLERTMTSVPKVLPGDMVFWHCDVVHSVEEEHTGKEDSCVMYIPAVPTTPHNMAYVERQRESFLKGIPPPDFPKGAGEAEFVGTGVANDIVGKVGREAMGLPIEVA